MLMLLLLVVGVPAISVAFYVGMNWLFRNDSPEGEDLDLAQPGDRPVARAPGSPRP